VTRFHRLSAANRLMSKGLMLHKGCLSSTLAEVKDGREVGGMLVSICHTRPHSAVQHRSIPYDPPPPPLTLGETPPCKFQKWRYLL